MIKRITNRTISIHGNTIRFQCYIIVSDKIFDSVIHC